MKIDCIILWLAEACCRHQQKEDKPRSACWNWLKNTVLAEMLWEENTFPAKKKSRIWSKPNGAGNRTTVQEKDHNTYSTLSALLSNMGLASYSNLIQIQNEFNTNLKSKSFELSFDHLIFLVHIIYNLSFKPRF